MRRPFAWTLGLLALGAGTAQAQQAPGLGYVYPPGGAPGAAVSVVLGGYDWTPDMDLFVHAPGARLELTGKPGPVLVPPPPYWFGPKSFSEASPLPREFPARFHLPADLPEGPLRWQAANANGATATGVFWVSRTPSVLEERPRRHLPQRLPSLPMTVHGRIDRIEQVDAYRFQAAVAGPITIEARARRLGSPFNACFQVLDPRGVVVADASDTEGIDPSLTFEARAGVEYEVRIHDLDFNGDFSFVYSLSIQSGPRILAQIPAFSGPGGSVRRVEDWGERQPRTSDPVPGAPITPVPQRVEGEGAADVLGLPVGVTTPWLPGREETQARFTGGKGQAIVIRVRARSLGSPLDPLVSLVSPEGKVLASNDDLPGTTEAGLEFTLPEAGVYTVRVREQSGRRGPAALTHLDLRVAEPGFELSVGSQTVAVRAGSNTAVEVKVQRKGGWTGPVELRAEGLPDGVTASAVTVGPGQNSARVTIQCAPTAGTPAGLFRITGVGGDLSAAARAPAAGSLVVLDPDRERTDRLLLATTLAPRCTVQPVDKDGGRTVNRGVTYPAEVLVERLEGYTGEVQLWMAARQARVRQGITGPEVAVPPGVGRLAYPCFMPEWLETSRTSRMTLVGVTPVADARGRVRHLVNLMDGRITMSLEGALLRISHPRAERVLRPGETLRLPFNLFRSPLLAGTVKVELVLPDDLPLGFRPDRLAAEPLTLPAGTDAGELRARLAAGAGLRGRYDLTLRCTALRDGRYPVVSETIVPVEFEASPTP